ncbi:GNAT family N-acetyltransferase [Sphingobium sp. AN641]|uniref:GNAT family N-acetyltransferase n=1 Tax=Sphingobium sp. AN641 TaxID=3133443 RepID=UPI0030BC0F82
MTPIRWRRAEPGDARALAILGGATFLASFAHDHPGDALVEHIRSAHSEDYYRAAIADPAQWLLLGETPLGAPVGYAMLTPPDLAVPLEAGDIELKRIYLLSGWQGGGNGGDLMRHVMAQARSRGARRLLLAVYPQNEGARRFYARHGFEQIGRVIFMVGATSFEDLVYACAL